MKFLADVEPCLAENQKSSKYTVQNITEAILKFACEWEGDHIARKSCFINVNYVYFTSILGEMRME